VVPGEPLQQPVLVVRVNQRGNHYLSVGGTSVHLAGLVSQSTQVRIALYPQSCDEAD
jgi:CBS-domain-containing membrane protein